MLANRKSMRRADGPLPPPLSRSSGASARLRRSAARATYGACLFASSPARGSSPPPTTPARRASWRRCWTAASRWSPPARSACRAGGDREDLRRQRPGQGARGGRRLRPDRAGRRLGPVGGGAGRRAGHLLGPLGRARRATSATPWRWSSSGWTRAESDDRAAWFTCALAVAWPGGPAVVVEGRVDGALTFPPRGDKGFGYDPIFVPEGDDAHLRRDGRGGEGRAQPPRPRLRQAEGGAV